MEYSFRNCPLPKVAYPNCKTYLSLYVFHTDTPRLPVPDPTKGVYHLADRITPEALPKPNELKYFTYHGKVVTRARGVYLAFLDQGVCASLTKFTISYNYCSERGSFTVRFPRTVAPVNDSQLVETVGECIFNSVSTAKLSGVCLSSGEWNSTGDLECSCKAGYEIVNGSEPYSLECKGVYLPSLFVP